jgi:asparagine synthase (glutamine-hydrolysing)
MQAGFAVVSQDDDVQFQLFGPHDNTRPSLVSFFRTSDCAAVLMGRLYYRRELLADVISHRTEGCAEACASNDAALALAAYRHGGLRGIERLEGDFALVIWDARERCLVGSRDPMGGYPLFWMEHNGVIALSTGMRPLLALLPRQTLDIDYLAEFLMVPGPVNERASERCAYTGVHRLGAGSLISIRLPAKRVEPQRYWDWLERMVHPKTDRLEEVSEQYADLLSQAVRERICGRTAAHFSGGMDSTAVSLLAHRWLGAGVGEAPLHTFSLVYHQLSGLARETPYLDSALHQHADLVAHRIPADDLLDFDSFAYPPLHDEPYVGLWRMGMDRATIEAAAQVGAATLLTGLGADELLDVQPFYLTELLRRGRLHAAWTEACKWARVDNCSPWKILYPFGIANLFPAWTHGGLGRTLLPTARGSWKKQYDWAVAPWITPHFARRHALQSRAVEHAQRTYRLTHSTGLSFALSSIESRTGDVVRWSLAAPYNMVTAHPFLDPRVLCFGLGIQIKLQATPGTLKPVLAEAMRGILPEKIRTRRRKGHFNEVYYLGLARNLQSLETMIRQAPIDDLGMLDKNVLIRCLQEAALGGAGVRPLHRFNLTLSLLKWLCMQEAWQRTAVVPTEVLHVHRGHDSATGRDRMHQSVPSTGRR